MNQSTRFILGTVVLAVGIAMAAAAGSRLGSGDFTVTSTEGAAVLGSTTAVGGVDVAPVAPLERIAAWAEDGLALFGAGLLVMLVGAVMARRARQQGAATVAAGDGRDWPDALARLRMAVSELRIALADAAPDELRSLRDRLESIQADQVEPLIEMRGALEARHGLAGYVAVLGPLSAAERLLSRAWSALVDRHAAEACSSLELALASISNAEDAFADLSGSD